MTVKIKKLNENAVIPKYSKNGDAGMDLVATSKVYDEFENVSYGTGLAFEIPEGYVGLLFPRSSICKQDLILSNSVGVLDSGYRGEVSFKFKLLNNYYGGRNDISHYESYNVGDRIGQIIIIPHPKIEFEEVSELSETDRNIGGFGSTGN